ncbi:hypothetical protein HOC32_04865 [Candidatus Woesearchaeota archaeon]|jgi:hypothetical protein|nr:hypothetical protein [Candidatus Woesearchaeota archaeon]
MTRDNKFYQNVAYLNKWKPVLDEKSRNPEVLSKLQLELRKSDKVIKVLECGAGTGSGLISLIKNGTLTQAHVSAFDIDPNLVAEIPNLFQEHALLEGWDYHNENSIKNGGKIFRVSDTSRGMDISVNTFTNSVYTLGSRQEELEGVDLVTGQAFIEHTKMDQALDGLLRLMPKDALVYFHLNCDGWFQYSPSSSHERDEKLMGLFNDLAMNNQKFKDQFGATIGGMAFCGRVLPYLFHDGRLNPENETGQGELEILAFGPSDWVITPYQQSDEELKFLEYTAAQINGVCTHPNAEDMRNKWGLTTDDAHTWYEEKLLALGNKSIGFTCVQKDILGKKK